jgi:type I restriction enzyme S subunit
MEKKLPKGWVESTLGEIANWGSGGTPSRSRSEYYNGDIPWIKTGDLNNSVIMEASEFITELGLKNSSAKLFPKGSIGIAMYGATIGKTAFFGIDAATNQACAVAQPSSAIVDKFLHNYLKSQKQNFIDQGKGGAQPNISQTLIKAHPILLPPLPEQKRIVAKLDALFGHLDTLKTKLDHIPELLKNFRQQVLVEAFKLESNRVLLESVCEKIQDGAHHSPQEQFDEKGENQYLYITEFRITSWINRIVEVSTYILHLSEIHVVITNILRGDV